MRDYEEFEILAEKGNARKFNKRSGELVEEIWWVMTTAYWIYTGNAFLARWMNVKVKHPKFLIADDEKDVPGTDYNEAGITITRYKKNNKTAVAFDLQTAIKVRRRSQSLRGELAEVFS